MSIDYKAIFNEKYPYSPPRSFSYFENARTSDVNNIKSNAIRRYERDRDKFYAGWLQGIKDSSTLPRA